MSELDSPAYQQACSLIGSRIKQAKDAAMSVAYVNLVMGLSWSFEAVREVNTPASLTQITLIMGGGLYTARQRQRAHIFCRTEVNNYRQETNREPEYDPQSLLSEAETSTRPAFRLSQGNRLKAIGSNALISLGMTGSSATFDPELAPEVTNQSLMFSGIMAVGGVYIYGRLQEGMDKAQADYVDKLIPVPRQI